MMLRYAVLLPVVATLACDEGSPLDPDVGCTLEALPAVEVIAADAVTGVLLKDIVTVTARDGEYHDSDSQPGPVVGVAHERAGRYSVTVEVGGYATWSTEGVSVIRGQCHVQTKTLLAELQPTN